MAEDNLWWDGNLAYMYQSYTSITALAYLALLRSPVPSGELPAASGQTHLCQTAPPQPTEPATPEQSCGTKMAATLSVVTATLELGADRKNSSSPGRSTARREVQGHGRKSVHRWGYRWTGPWQTQPWLSRRPPLALHSSGGANSPCWA